MNSFNKGVEMWAESKGFDTPYETAVYFESRGYNLSVGYSTTGRAISVTVPIEPSGDIKEITKVIKKTLKQAGRVMYYPNHKAMILYLKNVNKKKSGENLDNGIDMLVTELSANGVLPGKTCNLCGKEGFDTGLEKGDGIILPVHSACKQEHMGQLLSKIEENRYNGNYFLGTIGAILGAIVGAIPSILSVVFMDTMFSMLYALIPLGAVLGYRLFRGIANSYMRIVGIVFGIIVGIGSYVAAFYLAVIKEGNKTYGLPWSSAMEAFPFSEFLKTFEKGDIGTIHGQNLIYLAVFIVLGIVISWGYINKTNEKEEAIIRSMANQDYVAVPDDRAVAGATSSVPLVDSVATTVPDSAAPLVDAAIAENSEKEDIFTRLDKPMEEVKAPSSEELFKDL